MRSLKCCTVQLKVGSKNVDWKFETLLLLVLIIHSFIASEKPTAISTNWIKTSVFICFVFCTVRNFISQDKPRFDQVVELGTPTSGVDPYVRGYSKIITIALCRCSCLKAWCERARLWCLHGWRNFILIKSSCRFSAITVHHQPPQIHDRFGLAGDGRSTRSRSY